MSHVVLIFGGNGWIGSKVVKLLEDSGANIIVIKSKCRADDATAIQSEICEIFVKGREVTHIMSFIGRTHGTFEGEVCPTIDYLEKPGKLVENINDNLFSPITLAEIAKRNKMHFTYLGTGCIFDYDDKHLMGNPDGVSGFTESDKPNFFGSSYSIVKGFTDRLMHQLYDKTALNVRIRMPITDEISPRNFITKIINYAKNAKICSIPNSMTVLNEMLPIMINLALEKRVGTLNLTNPGTISHNEILEMYKAIVDPSITWQNFSIEEQNQILASKRSNNCLDTTYLETHQELIMNPIKLAVTNVLIQYAETVSKEKYIVGTKL
jgi:nucleoside-diphosphate-sugar epimerase